MFRFSPSQRHPSNLCDRVLKGPVESEALLQSCVSGGPVRALLQSVHLLVLQRPVPLPLPARSIAEKRHRAPLSGRQVWGSVYMALWVIHVIQVHVQWRKGLDTLWDTQLSNKIKTRQRVHVTIISFNNAKV